LGLELGIYRLGLKGFYDKVILILGEQFSPKADFLTIRFDGKTLTINLRFESYIHGFLDIVGLLFS
jgi:hypothetical protein